MEAIIFDLFNNFWELLTSIAIYILIGVILAGVFKLYLPETFIKRHLGGRSFMSNIKAAIIGIPLPLCSCSVIPFVSALKKSGASKSAIQTFLISTPITGADSILATYGVFGWVFTAYRTASSVIISLLAGFLSMIFVKEDPVEEEKSIQQNNPFKTFKATQNPVFSVSMSPLISPAPVNPKTDKKAGLEDSLKAIYSFAFDDIYKDIAKSLMIGIFLGALVMTFMPENLSELLSSSLLLNYFLVLLIAMPLYVCATSSVPLGIALLSGGFSPGAVFIFLTAGPATNAITMSVVIKALGKKSLVVYLSSILLGSLFFAFIFDWYFTDVLKDIMLLSHEHETISLIDQIAGFIMIYLSFKYITIRTPKKETGDCSENCGCA